MKGLTGLIVALVLGVLAVALNWFYLESKTKNFESIEFLGIKSTDSSEVVINSGDTFKESHFEKVTIPAAHARDLEQG